ncbi:MAG: hypothetical protein OEY07_15375, partial [Gammaproteobacteria bacterium]|nr:hypothetical protein [Gammaproteobacteria bacterium]
MAMTRKRKTILASIGAVVLVFFVYLLIDESLRPEVNADLEYKPAYVDPKQNGYYAYLGLRAEPGMDPWQAGWKVQQVFDRYLADGGSEDNIPVEKYTWVDHIELKSGNMRQYFGCGGGDCFSAVKFHRTIVAESLPQYQEVLARYNKMQTYPAFQETVAAPGLTGRILLHQLFQAKVSLMWQTGKKQTALQMLIDDLAYWRRISVNDTGMTMKMVISAMIDVDMKLYGALISSDMTFLAKQGLPQQITNAFTTQELSL